MAINYNRQYQPVSTYESAVNAPLSVRMLSDLADSINNWRYCIGNFKSIMCCFATESQSGAMYLKAATEASFETPIAKFGPIYRDPVYNAYNFIVGHFRSASGGEVEWRIYCTSSEYIGKADSEVDPTYLGNYEVTSFTTSSNDHAIACVNIDGIDFGDKKTPIFFLLTAESNDGATQASITTIDAKPMISERI